MPLGLGWGQNIGLRISAIFRLCCRRGHPCFTNTCLVHNMFGNTIARSVPYFIFEQYSISFRNLSCTTCAYRVYTVLTTLCQMFIRYSGKKVLVTYVYFGTGYCAFAQVIFTVIYACCLNHTICTSILPNIIFRRISHGSITRRLINKHTKFLRTFDCI